MPKLNPLLESDNIECAHKGKGYNNDLTTDHFVVIVGMGYDDKGKLYYLFYDVGTNSINEKQYKAGSNDYNRLYLQNDYSLRGRSQIPSKHFYVVTQIRRNIR